MLAPRIENIALSGTMEISTKIFEMKSNGIKVLDLCVGESDLPTPDNIKKAAQMAIDKNKTKYTINSGITELRSAISDKLLNDYDIKYDLDEIIVSNGAKQAIYNALQTIISEGDEVLIPAPYYVSYPPMVKLAGGNNKIINTQTENSYKLTVQEFNDNIGERTKVLILCNPNNPTGALYGRDELQGLVEVALKNNIIIIADEIYDKFIYDKNIFTSISSLGEEFRSHLVVINGVSKAYAMTGWRIGYTFSTRKIISGMNKLQSHSTSNACTISQYAALEALTGNQSFVEDQRKIFEERRNLIHNSLTAIDSLKFIDPQGAFYYFIDIKEVLEKFNNIQNSKDFCLMLLNDTHVAAVPGSVFGMEGYIRISYAKSKIELLEAMERIKDTLTISV